MPGLEDFEINGGILEKYNGLFQTVNIPNNVTEIGKEAFAENDTLENVVIPSSVTKIGNKAFKNCVKLSTVTISQGVKYIDGGAFSGCSSIKGITLPSSIKEIGGSAFYACVGLEEVTILGGSPEIDTGAFLDCKSIIRVNVNDLEGWCGAELATPHSTPTFYSRNIYFNGSLVLDMVIPETVTKLGSYVFCNVAFSSITLPRGLKEIGTYSVGIDKYCTRVEYKGSKKEWKAVEKTEYWAHGVGIKKVNVICNDGKVTEKLVSMPSYLK